jgi:hypothetical protein
MQAGGESSLFFHQPMKKFGMQEFKEFKGELGVSEWKAIDRS